jgi:hypothetical protein
VASQTKFIVHELACLLSVLAPTLDTLQTIGRIPKLCRKADFNISRLDVFPIEKANNQSLLELHENDDMLNVHDDHPKSNHFHWREGIDNSIFAPGSSNSSDT